MESRKGQDQRQLPASLATTFPRICHRRKNLLALNRTLQGTRYKLSILKVIYKMFHNVSPSSMSIHISKSQPLYNLQRSHGHLIVQCSIFQYKHHEIFNSLQRDNPMEPFTMQQSAAKQYPLAVLLTVFMSRMKLRMLIL